MSSTPMPNDENFIVVVVKVAFETGFYVNIEEPNSFVIVTVVVKTIHMRLYVKITFSNFDSCVWKWN